MRCSHLNTAQLVLILGALLLCRAPSAIAEQLPLRHFGVYEGLPHSSARCLLQDSRGYLWIGTADGLARFDGYRFTTYDTSDGLGHSFINSLIEDREGRIWVSTNGGGVSCFIDWAPPTGSKPDQTNKVTHRKFLSFELADQPAANRVNNSLFDSNGRLWCTTDAGLYRASVPPGKAVEDLKFELIVPHVPTTFATGAFADTNGRLWFGNGNMIIEAVGERIITYGPGTEFGGETRAFAQDGEGRVLACTDRALLAFVEPPAHTVQGTWKPIPVDLSNYSPLHCLMVDSKGAVWIGAEHGLIKYKQNRLTVFTTSNGLSDDLVVSLLQDRDANQWIGTAAGGLCMLSAEPAVGFGRPDGLPDASIARLFQDHNGHVYVSTRGRGLLEMTDSQALPIKWSQAPPFSEIAQRIRQDSRGDWWVGTERGLFLFQGPDLDRARGRKITSAEGAPNGVVGEIYQSPDGKLWFGSPDGSLYCIDRSGPVGRPAVHCIPTTHRFPYRRIIGDQRGTLWIGGQSEFGRFIDGRDSLVQPGEGLPAVDSRAFFLDSRGWLWIGLRNNGLSVCKDPSADVPHFANYTTADGLVSNNVWSITEDDFGRIYLGTGKGLDRLDPGSGRIQHITAGQKLVGDVLVYCMKDNQGNIWAATTTGLLKLDPRIDPDQGRTPPIYLTKLQVAGAQLPMPEAGAIVGAPLTLGPSGNNLLIEYVGLDFHSDRELKYQYKLEPADADWGPLTDQRSVNYASLAPGKYRFMVRAVSQQGIISPEPAIIDFRVLPPIWRRWWFVLASAVAVGLAAYGAHRYRVARLVELLAVRTRIASDLHDDIGSNLTKIAILSEVAFQQLGPQSSAKGNPLTAIARISRESVASMSDIVWAIDPRKDSYNDLIRRMRQFAIDMLGAGDIDVRILVSGGAQPNRLGPDFRRQVFLVFKEAVNNAARHSGCSKVEVEIGMSRKSLTLRVQDNGRGFDPDRDYEGQGLLSMRRRALALGGTVEFTTGNQGTTVAMSVPWTR
jgi:ligand-binding sensor domain-containing protein/two-component sensor histidine kinase